MGNRLEIFTLGGLSLKYNDVSMGKGLLSKARALLVYLALERREHQREALATLLWAEMDRNHAMGSMRMVLFKLQQEFSDYLIVTRQTVAINPQSDLWIDALHIQ